MPNLPPPPEPPLPGIPFLTTRGDGIRASDEDRDRVTAQLTEHHVAGRLDTDELRERTAAALHARTLGDLRGLLTDLPTPRPLTPFLGRSQGPFPGTTYGGFWERAGGLWLDLLVFSAAMAGLDPVAAAVHVLGFMPLFPGVYFAAFWGAFGRTPGMWVTGVRVVRAEDGGRLGFRRSLLRAVGYLVDGMSFGVGFLWAAADSHRQAWHDKIAGSYVIRSR